jgi:hypothetical protein
MLDRLNLRLKMLLSDREDCIRSLKKAYGELGDRAFQYGERAQEENFVDLGHLRMYQNSVQDYTEKLKSLNEQISLLEWIVAKED